MASCVLISLGDTTGGCSKSHELRRLPPRTSVALFRCRPSESNEVPLCFHQSSLSGKYIGEGKKRLKGTTEGGEEEKGGALLAT